MKILRIAAMAAGVGALLLLPATGYALNKGTGRLVSVTAVDGGCLAGPTGPTTEAWDVEAGYTYRLRIENVTECANGGTDPTLDVRVNSSIPGAEYVDLVAVYVADGVYEFDYSVPANGWCTLPILYCTVPGQWLTTGLFVRRHDGATNSNGVPYTSHLRVSTWDTGCTNPVMIIGPECGAIPTKDSTWGKIKELYR